MRKRGHRQRRQSPRRGRRHADDWGLPGAYAKAFDWHGSDVAGPGLFLLGGIVVVAVAWFRRLRHSFRPPRRWSSARR